MSNLIIKPSRGLDLYVLWHGLSNIPLCWGTYEAMRKLAKKRRYRIWFGPYYDADLLLAGWYSTSERRGVHSWDDDFMVPYMVHGYLHRSEIVDLLYLFDNNKQIADTDRRIMRLISPWEDLAMSTDTLEDTTTELDTVKETDDTGDVRTHIINPPMNMHIWKPGMTSRDVVDIARAVGAPVQALCGHIWVPTRNPDRYPACDACVAIAGDLMRSAGE